VAAVPRPRPRRSKQRTTSYPRRAPVVARQDQVEVEGLVAGHELEKMRHLFGVDGSISAGSSLGGVGCPEMFSKSKASVALGPLLSVGVALSSQDWTPGRSNGQWAPSWTATADTPMFTSAIGAP
jgi:hypothetical protein